MAPRETPVLFGHAAAEAALIQAARAGKLHHAWLLAGPAGVGKATLAYRFARFLFSGGRTETMRMDPSDGVFRRVAAETHADLAVVERSVNPDTKKLRTEIVVDDIRAATGKFRMTAAEGGSRVIIIDRADEMNRNAANALLKMLEEPPPGAVLLLVAEAPGRLLPTVRSRCRRLNLEPLDGPAMAAALDTLAPDLSAAERDGIIAAAGGSPGTALALADTDGAAVASLVASLLRDPARVTVARAYAAADTAAKTDDAFAAFMTLLRADIARRVRTHARAGTGTAASLSRWTGVWQRVGALQHDTLRFHLEKREAVVQALLALNPEFS